MQNTYLNNILSLKIKIILDLVIKYALNKAHNTNHALYKSPKSNIV